MTETIKIERFVRITIPEEDAKAIISEISALEAMYDKEYVGGPYDEITTLQKFKRLLISNGWGVGT